MIHKIVFNLHVFACKIFNAIYFASIVCLFFYSYSVFDQIPVTQSVKSAFRDFGDPLRDRKKKPFSCVAIKVFACLVISLNAFEKF